MKALHEIDPNFRLSAEIPSDVVFHDPQEPPFSLYGLAPNDQRLYRRLPPELLPELSEGLQGLSRHMAGACVRFSTDAQHITVLWTLLGLGNMPHMAASGQSGMQLFEEDDEGVRLVQNLLPLMDDGKGCKREQSAHFPLPGGMRHYALYLPLYNGVDSLLIGLPPQAQLAQGRKPKIEKPILFYGSSITQGGCASKAGSCYSTLLCRRLDAAQINLGFAGCALGEEAMARYIASLPMSVFVMDYDHNAPNPEHLRKTHEPFFRIVRQAQPDLPIVLVSSPAFTIPNARPEERLEIIRETYRHALEQGDKNVYLVDGMRFFDGEERDLCTVDGCHPNDLGFWKMANALEPILRSILEEQHKGEK